MSQANQENQNNKAQAQKDMPEVRAGGYDNQNKKSADQSSGPWNKNASPNAKKAGPEDEDRKEREVSAKAPHNQQNR